MSQTFERVVDRKQSLVNALLQDVDESEEQYNVAARKHFYNIDTLIGWFEKSLRVYFVS